MLKTNTSTRFTQVSSPNDRLLRDTVRRALTALTEAQRLAIELAFYEGMSVCDIARYLDTPPETVQARIRDGMGYLRHTLRGGTAPLPVE